MRAFADSLIADAHCELIAITPKQAAGYELVLAGGGLPASWDRQAGRGGVVGWDLVLVDPKTLSILRWELTGRFQQFLRRGQHGQAQAVLAGFEELTRAHHDTVQGQARRLALMLGVGLPRCVDHPLDSAGQPLLHTHVVFGARGADGRVLDGGWVRGCARRVIGEFHQRHRELVEGLVGALVPGGWGPVADDGRAELAGLPEELMAGYCRPRRAFARIAACARGNGDL